MTPFQLIPVASVLHNEAALNRLVAAYRPALVAMGGEEPATLMAEGAPPVYFVVTGGTEGEILRLWAQRRAVMPDEPVFLLTHPGHNSLPAALEVLARLQQEGAAGRIFYLAGPDDTAGWERLAAALQDWTVRRDLRTVRLGLVGAPSDWLVASSPAPAVVRQTWGPEVVPIPLSVLYERLAAVSPAEAEALAATLVAGATEVVEPTAAALRLVAQVYLALRQVVDTYQLQALSLRCFDLVLELQTTGCYALARLNDEGIIAGCEGDVVSTLTLLWLQRLVGQLPWMANPARVDERANRLWVAHCTVPCSLVRSYRLRSHFESGLGVGLQGEMPLGPVTLVRLGGRRLEQLWVAEGEFVQVGEAEDLCRTQVQVQLTRGHVSELLCAPLGNHLTVVAGHQADRLRGWWEAFIKP